MTEKDTPSSMCSVCISALEPTAEMYVPCRNNHRFHRQCLFKWARTMRCCPLCREEFQTITVVVDGQAAREISPPPLSKTKVEELAAPLSAPYNDMACECCGSATNDEQMLICDCCDLGYHMRCLQPPLIRVPRGRWECPSCQPSTSTTGALDVGAFVDSRPESPGPSTAQPLRNANAAQASSTIYSDDDDVLNNGEGQTATGVASVDEERKRRRHTKGKSKKKKRKGKKKSGRNSEDKRRKGSKKKRSSTRRGHGIKKSTHERIAERCGVDLERSNRYKVVLKTTVQSSSRRETCEPSASLATKLDVDGHEWIPPPMDERVEGETDLTPPHPLGARKDGSLKTEEVTHDEPSHNEVSGSTRPYKGSTSLLDEILANQSMILVPGQFLTINRDGTLTQQTEQFEKYLHNRTVKEDKLTTKVNKRPKERDSTHDIGGVREENQRADINGPSANGHYKGAREEADGNEDGVTSAIPTKKHQESDGSQSTDRNSKRSRWEPLNSSTVGLSHHDSQLRKSHGVDTPHSNARTMMRTERPPHAPVELRQIVADRPPPPPPRAAMMAPLSTPLNHLSPEVGSLLNGNAIFPAGIALPPPPPPPLLPTSSTSLLGLPNNFVFTHQIVSEMALTSALNAFSHAQQHLAFPPTGQRLGLPNCLLPNAPPSLGDVTLANFLSAMSTANAPPNNAPLPFTFPALTAGAGAVSNNLDALMQQLQAQSDFHFGEVRAMNGAATSGQPLFQPFPPNTFNTLTSNSPEEPSNDSTPEASPLNNTTQQPSSSGQVVNAPSHGLSLDDLRLPGIPSRSPSIDMEIDGDEMTDEGQPSSNIRGTYAVESRSRPTKEHHRQRSERVRLADAAMKSALKPFYEERAITKSANGSKLVRVVQEEYKEIMKKGVSKLRARGSSLKPTRVESFVSKYVDLVKTRRARKR